MKIPVALYTIAFVLFLSSFQQTMPKRIVPVNLKTLDGKNCNSSTFTKDSVPIILVFWISFHKNPAKELDAIAENYVAWKKETGVKVIAIAEDDNRTSAKINAKVNEKEWEFEFYLDPTQDFKRAMNVNDVPHTFVINASGEVVWEKIGYAEGDENTIYSELKKLTDNK